MTPEAILRSDVLDIIFENRNKQYGAYTLRREYNRRLVTALIIMLMVVLCISLSSFFKKSGDDKLSTVTICPIDSVILVDINPPPDEPKPKAQVEKQIATIKNPPPVIVPDNVKTDPLPTVDDMIDKKIGLENIDGTPDVGISDPVGPEIKGQATDPATPEPPKEPEILDGAEFMPEYPGGVEALRRFLSRNLNVPEDAVEPGQRIKIPVKFVVTKDGNLSAVEFLVQPDERFKKEILRVMSKMPKWKPGSQHGKTVNVYYTIPIIFEMPEG